MLVLTRKPQERIRIGDSIVITVLRTKGKAVSLGIEAPDHVSVVRGELVFQDTRAGEAAANAETHTAQARTPRTRSRPNERQPSRAWPSSASPRADDGKPGDEMVSEVALRRVPRDAISDVLPRLAAGGPLRTLRDHPYATR